MGITNKPCSFGGKGPCRCNFVASQGVVMEMVLTLDIGNTRSKYVLWNKGKASLSGEWGSEEGQLSSVPESVEAIAWCSTSAAATPDFTGFNGKIFELNHHSRLPFVNEYRTPQTLGRDRIAAVAGAAKLMPGKNVMVIDAGTCVTTDFLDSEGHYLGGSISPGLVMRYRALEHFTGKLPLVEHRDWNGMLGKSTEESILSGVWNGLIGELHYRIHEILKEHEETEVLMTGGDAPLLANHLKYRIFAEPLLVHTGLLYCLELNEI